ARLNIEPAIVANGRLLPLLYRTLWMTMLPVTAYVPGTHGGVAAMTEPGIGVGKVKTNVRLSVVVTTSVVPEHTLMEPVVYSPPPSDLTALGVVAPVEGSVTASLYSVTRTGMSWHLAADAADALTTSATMDANARIVAFMSPYLEDDVVGVPLSRQNA